MGDCPFFRVFIGGCGASYLGVSAGGGNCLFITSAISLEEMPLHCSLTGYMVSLVVFSVKSLYVGHESYDARPEQHIQRIDGPPPQLRLERMLDRIVGARGHVLDSGGQKLRAPKPGAVDGMRANRGRDSRARISSGYLGKCS